MRALTAGAVALLGGVVGEPSVMKPAAKVRRDIELIEPPLVAGKVSVGEIVCATGRSGVEELPVVVPDPRHVDFGHQLVGAGPHGFEICGPHQAWPGGVVDSDPKAAAMRRISYSRCSWRLR